MTTKKKKNEIQMDDRIDEILRESLSTAVRGAYQSSNEDAFPILDRVVALVAVDERWVEFRDSFRNAVQIEAAKALDEIKTRHAKLNDELERERKDWRNSSEKLKEEKKRWAASSDAFKDVQTLIELADTIFEDESDCDAIRLECKRSIFNLAISKLDQKRSDER